jgi:hypothetical protein
MAVLGIGISAINRERGSKDEICLAHVSSLSQTSPYRVVSGDFCAPMTGFRHSDRQ